MPGEAKKLSGSPSKSAFVKITGALALTMFVSKSVPSLDNSFRNCSTSLR
jgi:hypothetical protein